MSAIQGDGHPLDLFPHELCGDERADALVLIGKAEAALARAETLSDLRDVMAVARRARRLASVAMLGNDVEGRAWKVGAAARLKACVRFGEEGER